MLIYDFNICEDTLILECSVCIAHGQEMLEELDGRSIDQPHETVASRKHVPGFLLNPSECPSHTGKT